MDYSDEPTRSPELIVLETQPFNAEADISKLIEHTVTPESLAYVRNHGPVPKINPDTHELVVDGLVKKKISFTLAQLEKEFEKAEVVAAMQCAGNRRKVMNDRKRVEGIKWGEGIMINAKWTGYRLRDIVDAAGIPDGLQQCKTLHACFASEAPTEGDPWYGASVPIDMALDAYRSVLLATHMNGMALSSDHGFPIRIIIPGAPGARWVKWLQRITISDEESPNYYQQKDYKILPPHIDCADKAEKAWKDFPALSEMPINSAIASVQSAKGSPSSVIAKGYAVGEVQAVEVSADKGRTNYKAKLTYKEGSWSWVMWEANVPVSGEGDQGVVLWSRAISKDGEKQPDEGEWNIRGLAYNGVGIWEGKIAL